MEPSGDLISKLVIAGVPSLANWVDWVGDNSAISGGRRYYWEVLRKYRLETGCCKYEDKCTRQRKVDVLNSELLHEAELWASELRQL